MEPFSGNLLYMNSESTVKHIYKLLEFVGKSQEPNTQFVKRPVVSTQFYLLQIILTKTSQLDVQNIPLTQQLLPVKHGYLQYKKKCFIFVEISCLCASQLKQSVLSRKSIPHQPNIFLAQVKLQSVHHNLSSKEAFGVPINIVQAGTIPCSLKQITTL